METFILHFSEGVNGEYATGNIPMFKRILEIVNANVETNVELGGHSVVWAKRSQMEECKVYTTPSPDDFSTREI